MRHHTVKQLRSWYGMSASYGSGEMRASSSDL